MTEKETRELIELLRLIAEDSVGYDLLLNRAADALEDTLWKPIADMPDELKDGRHVLTAHRGADIKLNKWNDPSKTKLSSLGWWYSRPSRQPTHYREITAPEQEKADE